MDLTQNGGPAFPSGSMSIGDGDAQAYTPGMTLRDWFAGQAPEAPDWWMADECPTPPPGWNEGDGAAAWVKAEHRFMMGRIAAWRYAYADAMLAERDK